jgi:hypothetical protein
VIQHSLRTINHNIDQNIIDTVYSYKLSIKPGRLQGILGLYSKTFNLHINRLISLGILTKNDGFLSFTKNAKEQYKQGQLVIPPDHRARKDIRDPTKTTKQIRINIKRLMNKSAEKKEQIENIYLQIVSLAAFGAEYYKRIPNVVQLGMLCYDDYFSKKTMHFSSLKLKGVAVSDLVTKGPTKTDYLPTKRRNIGIGELFSYINQSKHEAEEYVKRLQNHDPPILKLIDSNSIAEPRYEIIDATLKDFIIDCMVTLFEVTMMMGYIWKYKKLMRTDCRVWSWYNRLFGKEGKGIRTAGEYASLQKERKDLKDKDKKTRVERIKQANKVIRDLKESIKYRYNNIILGQKYAYVRDRYYLISDPLIKIICPEFLQDKNGVACIKF